MTFRVLFPVLLIVGAGIAPVAAQSSQRTKATPPAQTSAAPAAPTAPADTSDVQESKERPPMFATGVMGGGMRFSSGRSAQAMSAIFQYQPLAWLTLSATPGYGRTAWTAPLPGAPTSSSSGLTDLPLFAGASKGFDDLPWSPTVGGALSATLALGDSSSGMGIGRSSADGAITLGVSPTDALNLEVGTIRPFTSGVGNGSLELGSSLSLGRTTATLAFSNELGTADSASALARAIGAGVAFAVAGPLTLTFDGSHGLSAGSPDWTLSVGFGTAFAGISPFGLNSPFGRLKGVFGKKVVGTSGFHSSSGSGNCHKLGTC